MVVQRDRYFDLLVHRSSFGRNRRLVYTALDRHRPRRRAAGRGLRFRLVLRDAFDSGFAAVVVWRLFDLDYLVDARRGSRRGGRVLLPLSRRRYDAVSGIRGSSAGLLRPGLRHRRLVRRLPVVVLLDRDGLSLVNLGGLLDRAVLRRRIYDFHLRVGVYARLLLAALGDRNRRRRRRKLLDRKVPQICVGLLDRARLANLLRRSGLGGDLCGRQIAIGRRGRCAAQFLPDYSPCLLDFLVLDLSVRYVRRAVRILRQMPFDALAVADACRESSCSDIVLLHAQVLFLAYVLEQRLDAIVKRNVLLHRLALFDYERVKPGLPIAREALYRILHAAARLRKLRLPCHVPVVAMRHTVLAAVLDGVRTVLLVVAGLRQHPVDAHLLRFGSGPLLAWRRLIPGVLRVPSGLFERPFLVADHELRDSAPGAQVFQDELRDVAFKWRRLVEERN